MKNESISIIANSSNSVTVQVLVEGKLVIKNANVLKEALLSSFDQFQNMELVLKNIIRIDLSVLQLLVALQKSFSSLDKNLTIDIELTDYVRSALTNSGFDKILITKFQKAG